MPKLSAGLLLYRIRDGSVEVLIGHPGGPFWSKKDDGAWTIPKGEYDENEDPWAAARREFTEELGEPVPDGPRVAFPPLTAAERKDHHRIRGLRRSRPDGFRQQHLHPGVAKGIGECQGVPGDRPGGLVLR